MSTYYIYYRIKADAANDVAARVKTMQEALHAAIGVQGQLHCHCDQPGTWMEIYPGVKHTQQFETALALAVKDYGLDDILEPDTTRHTERFTQL